MVAEEKTGAWICSVCGYVHRGTAPTGECPVCGAPADYFEPYSEPGESSGIAEPKKWRCLICNYEHSGPQPPDQCPVCDAPGKRFEAVIDSREEGMENGGQAAKIVIAGAGIAGISAVESIRKFSSGAQITVLAKENHMPYYRLNLTRFLAGEIKKETLPIHPEDWYRDNRVSLRPGTEVSSVSPEKKQVVCSDGTTYDYDTLILTAGAHPFMPPIPGANMEGVTSLRNLNDADHILREAAAAKSVVIIGGGVLGLETAGALAKVSKKISLIENFKWLMPRQLNETAALLLKKHVEGLGVSLKINAAVRELVGDERVAGVLLENGESVPADLVVITTGVRANSYLARLAGLHVNHGIIVDDYMETSHPGIYAAGDIAEHRGVMYGLWNAAQYQGSIAGMNAVGKKIEFGGLPRSNSIKVLGVDLLSIGKFRADDGSDVVIEAECEDYYYRFVFRDSHLVGSILYGNTAVGGAVKKAIESNEDFSGFLKKQPTAAEVWDYFKNF